MMRLTVVTATYNSFSGAGVNALERCLLSVAALQVEHEHLVVDGASSDGTLELLYAKVEAIPSLRIITEPDEGIYDALNKGLTAAKGEYVYFLGADDYLVDPDIFSNGVERCLREGLDVFIAPTKFSNGRIFPKHVGDCTEMAMRMAYSHQGCIARTELLRKLGGFDITCRCMADYKLMLAAHLAGARVGFGDKPFAMYDVGGTSSVPSAEREDEDDRIKRDVYDLTESELAAYRSSSRLPLRICRRLMHSPSAFTRSMGRRMLFSYIWRKHKTERESMRFLCGFRVFSHPLKAMRK